MTQAFCYWFTGLSGAGKSTIAGELLPLLRERGENPFILDGDIVRQGLCRDLGFSEADRAENQRRVAEVAAILLQAGVSPIVAFISPLAAAREEARRIVGAERFFEVYINTPLEVAEARDPKGLYKKVRAGLISQFTGISSPFEAPEHADCVVPTVGRTPQECARQIVDELNGNGKERE